MIVMKFTIRTVISSIACVFACGASAQENCAYLIKDVLTPQDISTSDGLQVKTFDTECAHYVAKLKTNSNAITFDGLGSKPIGIVAKASNAVLEQIDFIWQSPSTVQSSVLFCTFTTTPSEDTSCLTGNIASLEKIFNLLPTYIPRGNYKFWGLKPSDFMPYFKSITVTWHLAHFREKLTLDKLGTICLPYDVKVSDWNDELTPYTIAGKINSSNNTVEALVFEEVKEMKAGVAYLFVPKKTDICLKYYGTEETCPVNSGSGFVGSFENHTFTEEECKGDDIFLLSDNSIRLAHAGAGVGAYRAYIKMSEVPEYKETNSSRKLLLSADGYIETGGAPTVVEMLRLLEDMRYKETTSTTTYGLQGRMFKSTPMQGVILQSGKKRLIGIR